jgi:hypothetical protein
MHETIKKIWGSSGTTGTLGSPSLGSIQAISLTIKKGT